MPEVCLPAPGCEARLAEVRERGEGRERRDKTGRNREDEEELLQPRVPGRPSQSPAQ